MREKTTEIHNFSMSITSKTLQEEEEETEDEVVAVTEEEEEEITILKTEQQIKPIKIKKR